MKTSLNGIDERSPVIETKNVINFTGENFVGKWGMDNGSYHLQRNLSCRGYWSDIQKYSTILLS